MKKGQLKLTRKLDKLRVELSPAFSVKLSILSKFIKQATPANNKINKILKFMVFLSLERSIEWSNKMRKNVSRTLIVKYKK